MEREKPLTHRIVLGLTIGQWIVVGGFLGGAIMSYQKMRDDINAGHDALAAEVIQRAQDKRDILQQLNDRINDVRNDLLIIRREGEYSVCQKYGLPSDACPPNRPVMRAQQ